MNNSFIDLGNGYYLEHHGILGMKWGIRRYQPYSLVPRGSGKKGREIGAAARYDSQINKAKRKIQKNNVKIAKSQSRLDSDKAKKRDEKAARLDYKISKHQSNIAGKALYYDAHKAVTDHLEAKKARIEKKNNKEKLNIEKLTNKNKKLEKKIETINKKKLSDINTSDESVVKNNIKSAISSLDEKGHKQNNKRATNLQKEFEEYSKSVKKGESIAKKIESNPNQKLTKEQLIALDDYVSQYFYDTTGNGPGPAWTAKQEARYDKLEKIVEEQWKRYT